MTTNKYCNDDKNPCNDGITITAIITNNYCKGNKIVIAMATHNDCNGHNNYCNDATEYCNDYKTANPIQQGCVLVDCFADFKSDLPAACASIQMHYKGGAGPRCSKLQIFQNFQASEFQFFRNSRVPKTNGQ